MFIRFSGQADLITLDRSWFTIIVQIVPCRWGSIIAWMNIEYKDYIIVLIFIIHYNNDINNNNNNKLTVKQCPALQGSRKVFFREFFLKGKVITELRKLSGVFEHTFDEYKKNVPSLNYKIWRINQLIPGASMAGVIAKKLCDLLNQTKAYFL